jgi:hypothetical protein
MYPRIAAMTVKVMLAAEMVAAGTAPERLQFVMNIGDVLLHVIVAREG